MINRNKLIYNLYNKIKIIIFIYSKDYVDLWNLTYFFSLHKIQSHK